MLFSVICTGTFKLFPIKALTFNQRVKGLLVRMGGVSFLLGIVVTFKHVHALGCLSYHHITISITLVSKTHKTLFLQIYFCFKNVWTTQSA
jgi:hypothetical protein